MAIESGMHVQFHGICQGKTAFNALVYYSETTHPSVTGMAIADYVEANIIPDLLALLTDEYRLLEIWTRYTDINQLTTPDWYVRVVDESGEVTDSECMPSFCTAVITKIPDNDTLTPDQPGDTPVEFDNGFVGWSGIPESAQRDGLLTDAALTAWNAFAEVLESIEPTGASGPVNMGMYRAPTSAAPLNTGTVIVAELDAKQKIGTRTSRKR